ncbi:MAG: Lrp/AsnC family transcriptional regulator [Aestuariivirga sp.]
MALIYLDPADLRILTEIQRDGRITKLALAEKVGLSPTPCWTRLKRLEQRGIIVGYNARLALRQVVPWVLVLVELTLRNHRQSDFDKFERVVKEVPEIMTCWAVGGGVDYVLKTIAKDVNTYQILIDGLLARDIGIDRYFTYIVTKVVKDDPEIPLASLLS